MSEPQYEYCSACGGATGHAGYGDGSIGYLDGSIGPLCDECNQRLCLEINCECGRCAQLRQQLAESQEESLHLRAYASGEQYKSDFPTAADMRAELETVRQQLAEARELVNKVPSTTDGVPLYVGMEIWFCGNGSDDHWCATIVALHCEDGCFWEAGYTYGDDDRDSLREEEKPVFFSSLKALNAAEAAREKGGE